MPSMNGIPCMQIMRSNITCTCVSHHTHMWTPPHTCMETPLDNTFMCDMRLCNVDACICTDMLAVMTDHNPLTHLQTPHLFANPSLICKPRRCCLGSKQGGLITCNCSLKNGFGFGCLLGFRVESHEFNPGCLCCILLLEDSDHPGHEFGAGLGLSHLVMA